MVDEAAYHRAREQATPLPCVFQGALLARQAVCELAVRRSLAEREVLACPQALAHLNCELLERLFQERATFPLRLHPGAPLTHATVMRLQCGGLQGLQAVLDAPRADVHRLVQLAHGQHGSLSALPWDRVVQGILAWQPRRRTGAPPG